MKNLDHSELTYLSGALDSLAADPQASFIAGGFIQHFMPMLQKALSELKGIPGRDGSPFESRELSNHWVEEVKRAALDAKENGRGFFVIRTVIPRDPGENEDWTRLTNTHDEHSVDIVPLICDEVLRLRSRLAELESESRVKALEQRIQEQREEIQRLRRDRP